MNATGPRWAPGVVLTRLPSGGAVLVHGPSLALTEFGEREADLLHAVLHEGRGVSDLRAFIEPLLRAGWLLPPAPSPTSTGRS
ncbi:actinodefensin-associated protein B [Actinoplanes solisilvae]|uniref:actinodefensin-associated protein B n=1 Tax=Actinoplanes solisilvae TaxID=2486853 RepID=UPI000FD8F175|nr:actinodefensin-associated protein B [Actinoplanes solisilvae]